MIRTWAEPPDHVHHMTFDLAGFLQSAAWSNQNEAGTPWQIDPASTPA